MNIIVEDPQSDGSPTEHSNVGWVPNSSPTAPTPNQKAMLSPASKDWLSFLFMTLGWFLLLSSIIGFWRVKRWEQSVRPPAVSSTVEQVEEDQYTRRNLENVFGISFAQPPEDDVHQEESTNRATVPTQSSLTHARLTRDLRAAGLL